MAAGGFLLSRFFGFSGRSHLGERQMSDAASTLVSTVRTSEVVTAGLLWNRIGEGGSRGEDSGGDVGALAGGFLFCRHQHSNAGRWRGSAKQGGQECVDCVTRHRYGRMRVKQVHSLENSVRYRRPSGTDWTRSISNKCKCSRDEADGK